MKVTLKARLSTYSISNTELDRIVQKSVCKLIKEGLPEWWNDEYSVTYETAQEEWDFKAAIEEAR